MSSTVLGIKNTNSKNILLCSCFQAGGERETGAAEKAMGRQRGREEQAVLTTHNVSSVEMQTQQEFKLSREGVHHIGRHMTPLLGARKNSREAATFAVEVSRAERNY